MMRVGFAELLVIAAIVIAPLVAVIVVWTLGKKKKG